MQYRSNCFPIGLSCVSVVLHHKTSTNVLFKWRSDIQSREHQSPVKPGIFRHPFKLKQTSVKVNYLKNFVGCTPNRDSIWRLHRLVNLLFLDGVCPFSLLLVYVLYIYTSYLLMIVPALFGKCFVDNYPEMGRCSMMRLFA